MLSICRFCNNVKSVRTIRYLSSLKINPAESDLEIHGTVYARDNFTNVTPKILSYLSSNLHTKHKHPLSLVRQRMVDYFYQNFTNSRGNPIFSVYDNLSPIVSTAQNFDTLLIPKDHPSRAKSDCYYLNANYLLRAHTTAHQNELIRAGLDSFLVIGDVYRRDEIDNTHYPVFHQLDAVRLVNRNQLFPKDETLQLFEIGNHTDGGKQSCHTLEAIKLLEHELKSCLVGLAKYLFGPSVEYRWAPTEFPFTCPSWELEVYHNKDWLELLGCGIMKQPILTEAGVTDKVGWAFGIGLERVAMCLYDIPDIRIFWSNDTGFLNQFEHALPSSDITYKPISQYPQCMNDISFWLPETEEFANNDFYDIVRNVGGDLVEQVSLIDQFRHPKVNKTSHCYRIVYRHMEKTLTKSEVNDVHNKIAREAVNKLGVTMR